MTHQLSRDPEAPSSISKSEIFIAGALFVLLSGALFFLGGIRALLWVVVVLCQAALAIHLFTRQSSLAKIFAAIIFPVLLLTFLVPKRFRSGMGQDTDERTSPTPGLEDTVPARSERLTGNPRR